MKQTLIFWPMIVLALTTMMLYVLLYRKRVELVKEGKAKPADFRLYTDEPEESRQLSNALANQYELPVLFYAVCIGIFVIDGVSWFALTFAWAFTALKLVHIYIHITTNRLRYRQKIFTAALFFCILLWWLFALKVAQFI